MKPFVGSIDDAHVSDLLLFSTTLNEYISEINQGRNLYLRTNLGCALSEVARWIVHGTLSTQPRNDEDHSHPFRLSAEDIAAYVGAGLKPMLVTPPVASRRAVRPPGATPAHSSVNRTWRTPKVAR